METLRSKLNEVKSRHNAEVQQLSATIVESTLRSPALEKLNILDLSDQGDGHMDITGQDTSYEEKSQSLESMIHNLQAEK